MIIENLMFSLNATMPIFLVMVVGYVLKKIGWLREPTTSVINKLVFKVFLPCLLFNDLRNQDFLSMWDSSFVVFCFVATFLSIVIADICSRADRDKDDKGEFIQASYRSAAATLGIAFMTNIYDNVAMLALMILASVPLYNIVAVIVLTLTSPENRENGTKGTLLVSKTLKGIITNPIILGILVGLIWSVFKIPLPVMISKSVTYLGNVASPLALIGLGASFEIEELEEKIKPIICIVFNKLILFCLIFLPIAVYMGFRNDKLVAALIMLGSATTSSSFIMAKNMGHKGIISSSAVMTTTFLSSFTLTFWLFMLRTFGYI